MEKELDLRQIFGIIRKRIVWLLIFPLIAVMIAGVVSFFVIPPTYEASTTLLVGRAAEQGQMGYQDLMLNRQLVSTYSEIARSRSVAESVINALRLDMTTTELAEIISVSSVKDTEIIAIKVKNADPAMAKVIANQVAISFVDKVIGYSNIDNVIVVDEAVEPENPVSPNKKLNIAIAGVLGIMLAFGLIFLLEFLDNTIKTSADVEELLGLSVLAVVPVDSNGKGGR